MLSLIRISVNAVKVSVVDGAEPESAILRRNLPICGDTTRIGAILKRIGQTIPININSLANQQGTVLRQQPPTKINLRAHRNVHDQFVPKKL
jgi:hypothetical protein